MGGNRVGCNFENDRGALAPPDPIGLQGLDRLRPIDFIEAQQFIRIFGGLEEPLIQILFDDRRAAAFAMTVIAPDLFTRQGGIAMRAPIHGGHLAIGQTHLVQLDEEPFGPLVIFRFSRNRLALPVEHGAHRSHLPAHPLDVLERPHHRMDAVPDGGVFGGQAKRIEAHREQYVVALHALEAGARIGRRHRVPMPDVQVAAGIRQHGQRIMLGSAVIDHRTIQLILFPFRLPFLFHDLRFVDILRNGF